MFQQVFRQGDATRFEQSQDGGTPEGEESFFLSFGYFARKGDRVGNGTHAGSANLKSGDAAKIGGVEVRKITLVLLEDGQPLAQGDGVYGTEGAVDGLRRRCLPRDRKMEAVVVDGTKTRDNDSPALIRNRRLVRTE